MEDSFALTPHLTEILKQLDNAYAEAYAILQSLSPPDRQAFRQRACRDMRGSLIHRERNAREIDGYHSMFHFIQENGRNLWPLEEGGIRELHRILIAASDKKTASCPGQYKAHPVPVIHQDPQTGESRITFQASDTGVSAAMKSLVGWYNETLPFSPWTILVASEFVCRFLAINPFQEGNDMLGQGIFWLALLHSPSPAIATVSKYLAIDAHIECHRESWRALLDLPEKQGQNPKGSNTHLFVKWMGKVLQEALEELKATHQKREAERKLSERAARVLECFREQTDTRLTTAKLMAQTGFPRRTIIYALNTLLAYHLIQKYGQGAGVQYQLIRATS